MNLPIPLARLTVPVAVIVLITATVLAADKIDQAIGAVPGPTGALIQYRPPASEESYFALSLKPGELPVAASVHEIVVLVDTSASQAGAHRTTGLAVLEAFLAELPQNDRVRIFAVDLKTVSLNDEFAAPDSAQVKAALVMLHKRAPLGATVLLPALETAAKALGARRGGSILYIGDGLSLARGIPLDGLRHYIAGLRDREIAIHSFAVGPKTDLQLLGVLAEHTGGMVMIDELIDDAKTSAVELGRQMAQAADAPILFPTQISTEPDLGKLLPNVTIPLRQDRMTIWLGKSAIHAPRVVIKMTGRCAGREQVCEWVIVPAAAQPANTYLSALWAEGDRENGLLVPLAGTELLQVARQYYEDQIASLAALGRLALAGRDLKQVDDIAWMLRRIDPGNTDAAALLHAAEKMRRSREEKPPKATKPAAINGGKRIPPAPLSSCTSAASAVAFGGCTEESASADAQTVALLLNGGNDAERKAFEDDRPPAPQKPTTEAGEKLYTRVYPVGDLVIPLMNPMMSMVMMGGGGMMRGGMGMI